jgi:hypothetical protein
MRIEALRKGAKKGAAEDQVSGALVKQLHARPAEKT